MTNHDVFTDNVILLVGLFISQMREGERISELVTVIVDPEQEGIPDELLEALDAESDEEDDESEEFVVNPTANTMPPIGDDIADSEPHLRMGTILRGPFRAILSARYPSIALALRTPTTLQKAPCVVLAGGQAILRYFAVPALSWVAGGDA